MALQKNVRAGNGTEVQLRIEAFNVFNHINLGNPAVGIDNPATAGTITAMSGRPRQIQFGVRMMF